jgi:hypothetical protein
VDTQTSLYLSGSLQTRNGWQSISYIRWQGELASRTNVGVDNIGLTYGLLGPLGQTVGFGGNILRLQREARGQGWHPVGEWTWGGHLTGGAVWAVLPPVSMEIRHTRLWAGSPLADGLDCEMPGSMWNAGIGVLF